MVQGPLPPTEVAVLRTLLAAEGRVVSRDTIVRDGGLGHLSARRTDALVASLRRRLGEESILTVRQRGWMLSAEGANRARAALSASL